LFNFGVENVLRGINNTSERIQLNASHGVYENKILNAIKRNKRKTPFC
jgi:hypothetical protein